MKISRYYYVEQKRYSVTQLKNDLGAEFLIELLKKNICSEISLGKFISFEYVGISTYKERTISVFPKHYLMSEIFGSELKEMTTILKVLKKYSSTTAVQGDGYYLASDYSKDSNVVALADYILSDYSRNGYYIKEENTHTLNGDGEINWLKTIEDTEPVFNKYRPIYLDTFNISNSIVTDNMIINLHKYSVFFCDMYFGELLGYALSDIDTSIQDINNLGDVDELIGIVGRELSVTFNDQKCNQLRAIIAFLRIALNSENNQILYGIKTFENVWEKVCSFVINNEYDNFKNSIPKPKWTIYPNTTPSEKSTYVPDIIRTTKGLKDNIFFILDAKYYNIRYQDGVLSNNPGIGDVSKQLLYELALDTSVSHFSRKYNVFLFPAIQENQFTVFGTVNLNFLQRNPVHLVYVSSRAFFDMYLNGIVMLDDNMHSFAEEIEVQFKTANTLYEALNP